VVPRILIRQWSRLSKAATVYGPFACTSLPADARHPLRIPVMIVHTAPHVRCLPKLASSRMAPLALPSDAEWHREQAELLRGLL
jgi:hypothetical protein